MAETLNICREVVRRVLRVPSAAQIGVVSRERRRHGLIGRGRRNAVRLRQLPLVGAFIKECRLLCLSSARL